MLRLHFLYTSKKASAIYLFSVKKIYTYHLRIFILFSIPKKVTISFEEALLKVFVHLLFLPFFVEEKKEKKGCVRVLFAFPK